MTSLFGLDIVSHPLAVKRVVTWHVEPHPIRKRRRNWRTVRRVTETPCMFKVGKAVYAHPAIVAELDRRYELNGANL